MPKVSVILPVYNTEKFLQEAIDSILSQTFSDFELLLINDGSTDGSENIIKSCQDNRIVYLKNETNRGLIYSLNKAIDLAKGELIARMDADDIALPERLKKQVDYLEHKSVAILATTVKLIDAEGKDLPDWMDDKRNVSYQEIKKFLLKDNCIAHPSVMGNASIFKSYKYRFNQKYSEDYDLWLRIIADGLEINKLAEPLLYYRILSTSATRAKRINIFFRLAKVKFRFVTHEASSRRFTYYIFKAFLYGCFDLLKASGKEVKAMFTR